MFAEGEAAVVLCITALAIILGSFWFLKNRRVFHSVSGESTQPDESTCLTQTPALHIRTVKDLQNTLQKLTGTLVPAAVHGKAERTCRTQNATRILRSPVREYLETFSGKNEQVENSLLQAIEKLSVDFSTGSTDASANVFAAAFSLTRHILLGGSEDLRAGNNWSEVENLVKTVIKYSTCSHDQKQDEEKSFSDGELEKIKQELASLISEIIKNQTEYDMKQTNSYYFYLKEKNMLQQIEHSNLIEHLVELLLIGTDSLYTIFCSCITALANNQNVQQKIYDEVMKTVDDSSELLLKRVSLPFTVATVKEVLRLFPAVPQTVFWESFDDKTQSETKEPSLISVDLSSILTDSDHWEDPSNFRPERYLDPLGGKLLEKDGYVPFFTGSVSCPAHFLTEISAFFLLATLVPKFCFLKPTGPRDDREREEEKNAIKDGDLLPPLMVQVTSRYTPSTES